MRWLFLVLVAACGVDGQRPAVVDAVPIEPDAEVFADAGPRNDPGEAAWVQPYAATFTSPYGTLETTHLHAEAYLCTIGRRVQWTLKFTPSETASVPSVQVVIEMPWWNGTEVSGPLAAHVYHQAGPSQNVSGELIFDATRIDYPFGTTGAPRITGRFVLADQGWSFDQFIDVLGVRTKCLI